jgi:hypothetical protein
MAGELLGRVEVAGLAVDAVKSRVAQLVQREGPTPARSQQRVHQR